MSQYISELLSANEPDFSLMITSLENGAARPGVDVRLSLDIKDRHKAKMRELGLDPEDTTADELYHSLLALAHRHDGFLRVAIGGKDVTDANQLLPLIKKQAEKLGLPKIWGMKHSAAKRLLKKTPPKALMKALNYRSVDSLLKRENICEIYAALRFVESPAWLTRFLKGYKTLKPSDFEIRPMELIILGKAKWQKLAEDYVRRVRHNIIPLKEMGVILLLPLPIKKIDGLTLVALPQVLHAINELRIYSTLFKFHQVKPDFGQVLVRTLLEDPPAAVTLGRHPIHWRVVHNHFGRGESANHDAFEPHVHAEDLAWQRAEDLLYRLEPALIFWQGTDFVGSPHETGATSLNLLDVAASLYNGLPLAAQSQVYLRASLWDELLKRYLAVAMYEHQALEQLDLSRSMLD